jgi:hypothetical protein
MEEYYEKCYSLEISYLDCYERLYKLIKKLKKSAKTPEDITKIDSITKKYYNVLLSKEDLAKMKNEKETIINEYKQIENIITDSNDSVLDKTEKYKNIIQKSDIQPNKMFNNTNKKAMNINKLNNTFGQVIKGTDAESFSKMLENFRFTSTAAAAPAPAPQIPVINVSPVQVVQVDKKNNIERIVKEAMSKYVPELPKTQPESVPEPEPILPKKKKSKKKSNKQSRSFTIYSISKTLNCKEIINEGRYRANNPVDAARKAFNRFCNKKTKKPSECSYFLTVKETTRGSSGELNTYKLVRTKLDKPLVRFAGTPNEYLIKYGVDVEAVQTPSDCSRNNIDSNKKKSVKNSK